MARRTELKNKKRKDIYDAYMKLYNEKEHGVRKNTREWILEELGVKFYHSPDYVGQLVLEQAALEKEKAKAAATEGQQDRPPE